MHRSNLLLVLVPLQCRGATDGVLADTAMAAGHANPLTRQDVSDKILDHIVEQLKPQPDGSHGVCVCTCAVETPGRMFM